VLGTERRRSIALLAPLLRIADALDRSRDQRVEGIDCAVDGNGVTLRMMARAGGI
jgi:hypothetical protein